MRRRRFALNEDADQTIAADDIHDDDGKLEDLGVSQILSSLVQDEWQAIDAYKSAIATLTALGGHEAEIGVLEDIVAEEMAHVGQIEACAAGSAPEASEIESGKAEAEAQMAGGESPADESLREALDAPSDGVSHYGYRYEGKGYGLDTVYWMEAVSDGLDSIVYQAPEDDEDAQRINALSDLGREMVCKRAADILFNNEYMWHVINDSVDDAIYSVNFDECNVPDDVVDIDFDAEGAKEDEDNAD